MQCRFKENTTKHYECSLLGKNRSNTLSGPSQIRMGTIGFMEHFHEEYRNGYHQSWPHQVVSSLLILSSSFRSVEKQLFSVSHFSLLIFKKKIDLIFRSFEII